MCRLTRCVKVFDPPEPSASARLAEARSRPDVSPMPASTPERSPVIDMTVDGTILVPRSRWSRLLASWRSLPPGAIPAPLPALAALGALAVVLLGLALIVLPIALVLGFATLLFRGLSRSRR